MRESTMDERRDIQPGGTDLTTEHGRTIIADVVVAKIAGIATKEIEGVHELLSHGMGETIAGLAQRVTRSDTRGQGVRVSVEDGVATIDMRITCDYGISVVQVADAVRRNIISRVKSMTGLNVREVNIEVADLYFPESERAAELEQPQQRRVA
jgi:uncharacterized alkaline shock family protein YloU